MSPSGDDVLQSGTMHPRLWEQLDRYIVHEATSAERREVEEWLRTSKAGAQIAMHLSAALHADSEEAQHEGSISDEMRRRIESIVSPMGSVGNTALVRSGALVSFGSNPDLGARRKIRTSQRQILPRAIRSAVVALALGIVTLVGWEAGVSATRQRVGAATVSYATAKAQRATIVLSDGSTVALGVESRLEVPSNYAAGNRTVRLLGQGLFTVKQHDGTPFTVLAGSKSVRVLGTSFVVRHYVSDSLVTVAVRDGKVAVQSTVVAAGYQVAAGAHGVGNVQPADVAQFSFATGLLTVKNMPLPNAIPELNRWYDADIRLGDPSLASRRMTGSYVAGSRAELAMILQMTFDVRVVQNGHTLTLFRR